MNACLNKKPMLLGIPIQLMILLLTMGAVSFLALGSLQIILVCFAVYIFARIIYWYEPLFFIFLSSYLNLSDLNVSTHKSVNSKPFSDNLQWQRIVESPGPGIILQNTDGSFQSTYLVKGIDFLSEPLPEIYIKLKSLNLGLKSLAEYAVTIFWELKKTKCTPEDDFRVPRLKDLPFALDLVQKENLLADSGLFMNEYFLTISYKPEPVDKKIFKLANFFVKSEQKKQPHSQEQDIEKFNGLLGKFYNTVCSHLELTALNQVQTARYLHSCISTKVFNPDLFESDSSDWSKHLPDQSLYKGLNPILGEKFIKPIGIKQFPTDLNSKMRNEIGRLPFELRWIIRADLYKQDKTQKIVRNKKITWANSSIKIQSIIASLFTGSIEDVTEKFESNMADDCQDILDDIKENKFALSNVSSTIIVMDKDEGTAIEQSEEITKILENSGLTSCCEDLNAGVCQASCRLN